MRVQDWADSQDVRGRLRPEHTEGLLSLDLEGAEVITAIGAVRVDSGLTFAWKQQGGGAGLEAALSALDKFAEGATCVLGHNVIEHDLVVLARHAPDLKLLDLPALDTLYLSPLAFPENPYHRLVKQYQDPGLARTQTNDPLLDAELTVDLLADVVDAFASADPELLQAWHALLSAGVRDHAFDPFFRALRRVDASTPLDEAVPLIQNRLRRHGCPAQAVVIAREAAEAPLPLAFLLAWLPVAGGNSIIPPYVEKRFAPSTPAAKLRDSYCGSTDCP